MITQIAGNETILHVYSNTYSIQAIIDQDYVNDGMERHENVFLQYTHRNQDDLALSSCLCETSRKNSQLMSRNLNDNVV